MSIMGLIIRGSFAKAKSEECRGIEKFSSLVSFLRRQESIVWIPAYARMTGKRRIGIEKFRGESASLLDCEFAWFEFL